jgi:hypothetical protein
MKHVLSLIMAIAVASPLSAFTASTTSYRSFQGPAKPQATPAKGRPPTILDRVDSVVSRLAPSTADVDSFPDAAVNRRFRMRREAIATMQQELRAMVVAESTIHARTRFWDNPQNITAKDFDWDRFNRGRNVPRDFQLTLPDEDPDRYGWIYTIGNYNTEFVCSVFVGKPDLIIPGATEKEPWCRPDGVAGVVNQPPPYPRPQRIDPPPGMPWNLDVNCLGKGCEFGPVTACDDLVAMAVPDSGAAPLFTWKRGEERVAGFGQVQVQSPGMVIFRRPLAVPVKGNGTTVDTLRFSPADTVYPMAQTETGAYAFWYHRKLWRGPAFWTRDRTPGSATALLVRSEKIDWSVTVSHTASKSGFVRPATASIAGLHPTEGDGWSRCAATAKVTETPLFALYSDPWVNLHFFLYAWARWDRGLADSTDARVTERSDTTRMTNAELHAWNRALQFYRDSVAARPDFDPAMIRQRNALLGRVADDDSIPDAIPGIRNALISAMPVYRSRWWMGHNRTNRDFIQGQVGWLRGSERIVVETVERAYGVKWPAFSIRIDKSFYSPDRDATSLESALRQYARNRVSGTLYSLEALLRAVLGGLPLSPTPRAALTEAFRQANVAEPLNLWDAVLFATAGELTRAIAVAQSPNIQFTPNWIASGIPGSPYWKAVAAAAQEVWLPVVRGELSREEGYAALVKRFRR